MLQGDGHSQGAVRVLMTKDGGKFTEELVDFDAAARSYQYRIIESPAPVTDYVSTVQVNETAAGSHRGLEFPLQRQARHARKPMRSG